jgi:hypothetical protein
MKNPILNMSPRFGAKELETKQKHFHLKKEIHHIRYGQSKNS